MNSPDLTTATVRDFCRMSGLGVTKVYQMMSDGRLESVAIGKRRLILLASWQRLLQAHICTPISRPAGATPRPRGRPRKTAAGDDTLHT
jgi:hypothetical protein